MLKRSDRALGLLVGEDVELPSDATIGVRVVVYKDTRVGAAVRIGDGAVLGKPRVLGPRSSASREPLPPLCVGDGVDVGAGAVIMEGARIGARTVVEERAHVREGAVVGCDVVIGAGVSLDNDTQIGDRVEVCAGTYLTAQSRVEDDVVIGVGVTTTNDDTMGRRAPERAMRGALFRRGCRVGGGSVILPGIEVAEGAKIMPGAVVTRDVAAGAVVAGIPARPFGAPGGRPRDPGDRS